jgi:hypothetical protein
MRRGVSVCWAIAAAATAALVGSSEGSAHADPFADHPQSHTFLSLGAIGDVGGHFGDPGSGVVLAGGGELSAVHWLGSVGDPLDVAGFGFGAFGQLEASQPDGHARGAFGLQGSHSVLGAELGAAIEQGRGPLATTGSLHVAPFVSLGILYLAVRGEVPVAAMSAGAEYGFGLALVLGLKAPIPLDGGTILDSSTFH